jgi:hypothetical protein
MGKKTRLAVQDKNAGRSAPAAKNRTQSEKLKRAARELGTNMTEADVKEAMRNTAKAKPAKLQPNSERDELTEAAHMFEADHDEAAFEKRLKRIAKEESRGKKAKSPD